jgi:hypothetical protein
VQPNRQQSSRHQEPAAERRYLPIQTRRQIHPAVSAPQADSQEQTRAQQQKTEAAEASAQYPAPEQAPRIQQPSPTEGPAASEAYSFSSDPSSARFRKD